MHPYITMGLAWLACAAWIAFVIMTNKKMHPKALFYLFFVEMWERFSYYGMRALLVLYMTKGFLTYSQSEAYGVYGAYGAMVYATPLLGGYLAERFMGYRKSIMWGAVLMMIGHFLMAFEQEYIFLTALAMLIMGNGFFKPNISSMIGKFYARNDPRRDGAFTIFYMGINIGAFLTGLTCGVVGELEGWHYGFTLAGFGMLLGLIIFWKAQKAGVLEDKGYAPNEVEEVPQPNIEEDSRIEKYKIVNNPTPKVIGLPVNMIIYVCSLLAIPLIWLIIDHHEVLDYILLTIGAGMVGWLIYSSFSYEKVQRQRIWVVVTLFFFAIIFWTFFELAGSALTVFTDNNVSKSAFFTTTMFQSLNPFFIMVFAPIYSWIWLKLSKANKEPSAPVKFGIALVLLGFGFLVLNFGSGMAVAGMIPAVFMVGLYLFHTLGELALSPVGLSMVTKLAPLKIVGFVMGFWMMSSSFAHMLGVKVANMTAIENQEIVASEEFKSKIADSNLLKVIQNTDFQACINKDGKKVQDCVTTSSFVNAFSTASGKKYALVDIFDKEIYDKAQASTKVTLKEKLMGEAKMTVVTDNAALINGTQPLIMDASDMSKAFDNSINSVVNEAISVKTLGLSLAVFRQLGFFAIGCGVFLFLLSPIITRWMHGIR